jgi:cobalt-zinc-cadmium efflux system outer membrane protein
MTIAPTSSKARAALRPLVRVALSLFVLQPLAVAADEPELPSTRVTAPEPPHELPLEQAVAGAFARNRDVIASKLGISAAEVELVAARILPNPVLSYNAGNLSVGSGTFNCITSASNPTNMQCAVESSVSNLVHSVQLTWELEMWGKRGLRIDVAKTGIEVARIQLRDALRTIAYAVTGAWIKLQRANAALEFAAKTQHDYAETVRVLRARLKGGAIAGTDLSKIELEALTYEAAVIAARQDVALAQRALKELLAVSPRGSDFQLPPSEAKALPPLDADSLYAHALAERPDLRALLLTREQADRQLRLAHRVAIPNPALNVGYIRSENVAAGDNADTVNLGLAIALPIFDRNQGDIGRARVGLARAENDIERARLTVVHDVSEAITRVEQTRKLVDAYERKETDAYGGQTNMLERSAALLKTATAAYGIGATSLLELLEAQRAYINTQKDYLDAVGDYRDALSNLENSLGGVGIYGEKEITPWP